MLTLRWGSATDVGRVRTLNEDSLLAVPGLFVVADGMGGHAAGEVASQLAVAEFARLAERGPVAAEDLIDTVLRANEHILVAASQHGEQFGMGTTLTGVGVVGGQHGEQLAVFNVGDSRVYRFAGGQLSQLTVDHSAVQELVDAGQLTAQAARVHPRRNVVTRSLGSNPGPAPDVWLLRPVVGDRYLVCSDGLTGELEDAEIAGLLAASDDPQVTADELVRRAIAAGGHDNVTTVVMDVLDVVDEAAQLQAETAGVDDAAQADTVQSEPVQADTAAMPTSTLTSG
jgi:PPM family protein phosphatase